jgi:centractin
MRWPTDTCVQMWVEKDEWQENPDIIHTKFA